MTAKIEMIDASKFVPTNDSDMILLREDGKLCVGYYDGKNWATFDTEKGYYVYTNVVGWVDHCNSCAKEMKKIGG